MINLAMCMVPLSARWQLQSDSSMPSHFFANTSLAHQSRYLATSFILKMFLHSLGLCGLSCSNRQVELPYYSRTALLSLTKLRSGFQTLLWKSTISDSQQTVQSFSFRQTHEMCSIVTTVIWQCPQLTSVTALVRAMIALQGRPLVAIKPSWFRVQ